MAEVVDLYDDPRARRTIFTACGAGDMILSDLGVGCCCAILSCGNVMHGRTEMHVTHQLSPMCERYELMKGAASSFVLFFCLPKFILFC